MLSCTPVIFDRFVAVFCFVHFLSVADIDCYPSSVFCICGIFDILNLIFLVAF